MLQLIQDIIYEVTGKQGITFDTDFIQDLALNSFDVMNIISAFEEHFDTTIPTREVWHLHQVKDVINYLAQKGFTEPKRWSQASLSPCSTPRFPRTAATPTRFCTRRLPGTAD